jgi:DNA polymerase-4
VLAEAALHLIRKDADGTTYRLIGVGVDELGPASAADPPNLFGV